MTLRPTLAALAVAALLAGCGSSSSSSSSSSSGSTSSLSPSAQPASTVTSTATPTAKQQVGFEGVPIEQGPDLASPGTTGTQTVDGIKCGAIEQLAYHIHVHLAVYVNGSLRALPGGIGIPGSSEVQTADGPVAAGGHCIYWLHTHAPDGIIHVESPTQSIYRLGQFFDEWHQPLNANQVAAATGHVSAYVDGKPWTKDLRSIPLIAHSVIQFSVGDPIVPFQPMSWAGLQL
jgi:hypothetical protein